MKASNAHPPLQIDSIDQDRLNHREKTRWAIIPDLGHPFASHFMMNDGNILSLQKILGHSTRQMTMRYAHLSPDYLKEGYNLNPVSGLTLG